VSGCFACVVVVRRFEAERAARCAVVRRRLADGWRRLVVALATLASGEVGTPFVVAPEAVSLVVAMRLWDPPLS